MSEVEQYVKSVQQLARYHYTVSIHEVGYAVQHQHDPADRSVMRTFADLIDFADLIAWAAQHAADSPEP